MRSEPNTVALYALLKWAMNEHTERELAAIPPARELDALFPDTSALRERIFAALRQLRRQKQRRTWRKLKPLLIAVAVAASVLFATLMVNASMRATVVDIITEWTNRDVGIHFEVEGEPLAALPVDLEPHYIPEELIRLDDYCERTPSHLFYTYQSEDGSLYLDIRVDTLTNGSMTWIDNEHATLEETTFQGNPAYVAHGTSVGGDEISILLWAKDGLECHIYTNVSWAETQKIAEGIYY